MDDSIAPELAGGPILTPQAIIWAIGGIGAAATTYTSALGPYTPWILGGVFALVLIQGGYFQLAIGRR